jgi:hypothetical protein
MEICPCQKMALVLERYSENQCTVMQIEKKNNNLEVVVSNFFKLRDFV